MKKLLGLLFAFIFVFTATAPMRAQESAKKEARWEGTVIRISSDKSSMQVRKDTIERMIYFDSSTVWNSQYHGDKTVNKIDASEVKEGDYVICLGTYDEKNALHAMRISKRLSPSPSQ
jgi:hypothetical protein